MKNRTSNVGQFIEALTFICCKWRGQRNPRPEPIGIFQAGKGQVVARRVCATPRLCENAGIKQKLHLRSSDRNNRGHGKPSNHSP